MENDIGILLTNIGSPDQATPQGLRQYLKKFLSDPRVVEIPKLLWWPLLHGYILRTRPKKSAKLYQLIWTDEGSPLTVYSKNIAKKLAEKLQVPVELGMHYGNPSIELALKNLQAKNIKKIIILPLYPQYSGTTTAATIDQVMKIFKCWRHIPELCSIHSYADNSNYIDALCDSIQKHSIKHLLFSFHGVPKRCIDKGDPYAEQCHRTVSLVAEKLNLANNTYSISFQSRLGRAKWLTPYTDKTLKELPKRGVTDLHIICPGFAVDCLETLEEINIRGKEQFLQAGGKSFQYIPALNDSAPQLKTLADIIIKYILA